MKHPSTSPSPPPAPSRPPRHKFLLLLPWQVDIVAKPVVNNLLMSKIRFRKRFCSVDQMVVWFKGIQLWEVSLVISSPMLKAILARCCISWKGETEISFKEEDCALWDDHEEIYQYFNMLVVNTFITNFHKLVTYKIFLNLYILLYRFYFGTCL